MAYFAMLSGQGWTAIAGCRQFFYARCDPRTLLRHDGYSSMCHLPCALTYVLCATRFADYIVTMPLIVLLLGQVAAADVATIAATIGSACKINFTANHEQCVARNEDGRC